MEIVGVVASSSRVMNMKQHLVGNSAYLVLKIELLLTVLSNFEREVALEDSAN